ncbi:MAG TPA: glycosyltransferase family 39 protein [Methylomirabilota bacterium]|nr:glycosyltransferase family 39 protein [Methylomirabilota bacterium]
MDRRELRGALALAAFASLLLFFDVGVRVFASNDEARFAVLARDILDHRTWLLPRLGDTPYLNKPPLVAWLIALVSSPVGGVTQSTAIWPSLAAGSGITLLTWWIGRRLWDQAVGLTAGFVVLTMHGVFTQARTAMPDIVLCLAMTGAMAAHAAAEFGGRRNAMMGCHVLLALGFMAKGPVAALGLAVIAAHALITGEGSWWRRLTPLRSSFVIVPLIGPWWIAAFSRRGGEFVHDTVIVDWLQWFDPSVRVGWHALLSPFVQTLTIVLPWSPLLPVALVMALRAGNRMPAGRLAFLVCWLVVIMGAVALSSQQRMRYYLPLCPPAALLIALWYHRVLPRRSLRLAWATAATVAAALVTWQVHDDIAHNAGVDLRAVAATTVRDEPLYTIGVPNLVVAFYLDRSVQALDAVPLTAGRLAPGYFLVDDRAMSRWPPACVTDRLGAGAANRRPFSVLRLARPGCAEKEGLPSAG